MGNSWLKSGLSSVDSQKVLLWQFVPTNHHGAHAIESLPFVGSQKPSQSGLQFFFLIYPHNRVEQKKIDRCPHSLDDKQNLAKQKTAQLKFG